MTHIQVLLTLAVGLSALLWQSAHASPGSRLIATGGAMSIEGAAGGGIVPWALLAGYAEASETGGTAWMTRVQPDDFTLNAFGAAVSFGNVIELSLGRQSLDIDSVIGGETLEQDILGLKYRFAGELIYSQLPQFAIGLQHKRSTDFSVPQAVGARDDSGTDVYLAASKLWLTGPFDRSVFLNTTLRATKANQAGLLGFGGPENNSYQAVAEISGGVFLNRHWLLGAEYRQKPDNLSFAREDNWYDVFVGWFPSKRVSVIAAWSDLGAIAGLDDQRGVYLSVQISQ